MSRYRKLKVLILTYPQHIPPENAKDMDLADVDWRVEYDVIQTLKRMGQEVVVLGVDDELKPIRDTIRDQKPHIVFNLLDEFHGETLFDQNIVSYLELLKASYTGCNPRGLVLSRDKALSKKLLAYHRIGVPKFHVFLKERKIKLPKNLKFPLIVKSLTEESSWGIAKSSIVYNEEKLIERIGFIHDSIETDAIAEQFIEGREFYVGVIGNHRVEVLPPWELLFKGNPDDSRNIATFKVKWDSKYRAERGITTDLAKDLTESQLKELTKICRRTYKILSLSGYARLDLRLSQEGKWYILEANPNPHLGYEEDMSQSAYSGGYTYQDLLWKIMSLGMSWRPAKVRSTIALD